MMYIEEITLKKIRSCAAQKNRVKIRADLPKNIRNLMPYMNAAIPNAIYNKTADWLTFRMGEKFITFYPHKVIVTRLLNETDAYETLDLLRDRLNEIYEQRDHLVPSDEMRKRPALLDVFQMLPQKNCRKCGEMTCMAFATKLLNGTVALENCPVIREPEFEESFRLLKKLEEKM